MKIIDRYMLRQFVQTFLICYVSLAGIFVVFDAFTNLDAFMRCAEERGGLLPLMGSYYGYRLILFFDRTTGLLTLVSAMFAITWIQSHNEMTALMAAGVSRIRVVVPLVGAAVVITLLAAADRELVIPRLRDELALRPHDLVGDLAQKLTPRFDHKTDVLIGGDATYGDGQRISKPDFLLPLELRDYGSRLVAENAFYMPPEDGRPGGYLLEDVEEPRELGREASLVRNGQPVVITARDAPDWLEPDQCFVVSDISFRQLTTGDAWREYSSTGELIAGLRNDSLDYGAKVRVLIHSRIVQPLLDVTLLFLGLPLVLSRQNRNVFIAIGLCAGVVAVFMLVVIGCRHMGSIHSITPALAAWLPLLLFVPVAAVMSQSVWE